MLPEGAAHGDGEVEFGVSRATAIVTGGALGLGNAVAARVLAEGGNVALWDLNAEALTTVCDEIHATRVETVDVADLLATIIIDYGNSLAPGTTALQVCFFPAPLLQLAPGAGPNRASRCSRPMSVHRLPPCSGLTKRGDQRPSIPIGAGPDRASNVGLPSLARNDRRRILSSL